MVEGAEETVGARVSETGSRGALGGWSWDLGFGSRALLDAGQEGRPGADLSPPVPSWLNPCQNPNHYARITWS